MVVLARKHSLDLNLTENLWHCLKTLLQMRISLLGIERTIARRAMAPQLARDLAAMSGRKVSRQTVYSRLAESGLYFRRPV
ncbi:hypothetical protein TNCV_4493731 [Trichonephila clavipes]|nr:hypothetical protein TNCV_4493731 [Trichonephila clavipes]